MGFKFNGYELNASSAVSDATDTQDGVSFDAMLTAADRRALQELFSNAGRVQAYTMALGGGFNVDPTGGLNTFYLASGAASQFDSGWYACRSVSDSWQQRTTHARQRLEFARLAGPSSAVGEMNASTQFLTHDF